MALTIALLIIVGIFGYTFWSNKKRREGLQAIAEGLGWPFAADARDHAAGYAAYPLFDQGRRRRCDNLLAGPFGDVPVEVFDYRYTTGGGKSTHTHIQTVVHFDLAELHLPPFSVRPENMMHKVIKAFGYQDIDIPERPEFSKAFVLRGPDEAAIRARFADPLPDLFDANHGIAVDGGGTHLFVFREDRVCKAEELPDFLAQAMEFLRAFLDTEPAYGGVPASAYEAPPLQIPDSEAAPESRDRLPPPLPLGAR